MDDEYPRPNWSERLLSAAALRAAGASLLVGLAGAAAAWRVWLVPREEAWRKRSETAQDVLKLYGLQMSYKKAKGVYANDAASLLSLAPDAAERKARMAEHLDLSTLAVVGDARRFKIEANVLDAERTLVSIRGPIADRPPARPEPALRAEKPAAVDTGSPLQRGR